MADQEAASGFYSFRCPKCLSAFEAPVFRSIDPKTPDALTRVITGELFRIQCPYCGRKDRLEYDLSFYDPDHRAWIQVVHDPVQIPDYIAALRFSSEHRGLRIRIVHNIHELREKLMAFVMGRDDRILEIYKCIAKAQFSLQSPEFRMSREPLYAGSTDTGDEVISFYGEDGRRELVPLDEAYYQMLHQEYASRICQESGRYIYDSAWAETFARHAG